MNETSAQRIVAAPTEPAASLARPAVQWPQVARYAVTRFLRRRGPGQSFRESFRLLALTIGQAAERESLKTLLVMSAYPGDGRTTVAASLGTALVEAGGRVVIVEGDGRRPGLERRFARSGAAAAREAKGDRADATTLRVADIPGLELVLPARQKGSPVTADALKRLLPGLQPTADFVIIDSPPCLAYSDAYHFAPLVDGIVYVVRKRSQGVADQRKVQAQLERLGAKVLGVVFNER